MPPSQCMCFLGVEINTVTRSLALPETKLNEMKTMIEDWLIKRRASKRELLRLLGKLNWCARVVRGGRTFMRRLIDLATGLKANHHRTWLNSEVRRDILWWRSGLRHFHGSTQFLQDIHPPKAVFATDACLTGGGGVYDTDWFYVNFANDFPEYKSEHINVLELLTVLVAARRWGHRWDGTHIRVLSDNSATVFAINKGSSRSPKFMLCLRELFWLGVVHNFRITASHIKGEHNIVADMVSRLDEPENLRKFINMFAGSVLNFYCNMTLNAFLLLPLQIPDPS